ncbi:hypothetical protein SD72_13885 [Leucobacter komagatae]|uniref:Uncharacterized protein n=1 Tax=Leucobacter komagatae TaxID=55969 RepID=A0A0D0IQD2_9MICO|nr:hypothetical protein SD72_13885 [Leucobacter komagatae]
MPGFESSTFCDQEVGWMRGRSIPLHTLKYQTASPYGFFGRRQAQHVPDEWKASDVATNLVTWLSLQSEIAESFATSLALSLQSATSFDAANKRFGFIEHRRDLTAAQTAAVAVAARDNNQVANAEYRPKGQSSGEGLAHRILRFLKDQPGFPANAELISEVAEANNINDLGLIVDERDVDTPF